MRTTSSREVYRNPWIRVREDVLELDDGSAGLYGVVERPDFTLVIPAERDGFWLVEQFRYPLGRRSWEFPQGTWGSGEDGSAGGPGPRRTGRGDRAAGRPSCGSSAIWTSTPGLSTQGFDVWLATGLTPGPTAREATEAGMAQAFVPEAELRRMIRDGEITDSPTLAAFTLLLLDRG